MLHGESCAVVASLKDPFLCRIHEQYHYDTIASGDASKNFRRYETTLPSTLILLVAATLVLVCSIFLVVSHWHAAKRNTVQAPNLVSALFPLSNVDWKESHKIINNNIKARAITNKY